MKYMGTFLLAEALKAEGFPLPDAVKQARLLMPAHGVFVIQYDVLVSGETLAQLGRALTRLAETP
jgi:hypothetical protein